MITCNICRQHDKLVEDMQPQFRYVCKECWKRIDIYLTDLFGKAQVIDKDLIY